MLARRKYGEEGIEENKHLMQKFLVTIPEKISVILNEKKKDQKRCSGKSLNWEGVLEILEDMRVDEDELKEMYTGSEVVKGRTYKDALVSEELSVMTALLEECRKDQIERGKKNVRVNVESNGKRSSSRSQERFRSGRVGGANGNMRERQMRVSSSSKRCFRCGRTGHVKMDCRWPQWRVFWLWKGRAYVEGLSASERVQMFWLWKDRASSERLPE